MSNEFEFAIKSICFDEDYRPSDNTRITTNFANLARGTSRQENLRNTLTMIDRRFNDLMPCDNPTGDRYTGDFARGVFHGQGRFAWKNGNRYEGAWRLGRKHGQGRLTWAGGDGWEGEFRDDQQTDNGKSFDAPK